MIDRAEEAPPVKPPRALKIAHATFEVRADALTCEGHGAAGITQGDRRLILFRDDLPADKVREVVLHEALHAAVAACGRPDLFASEDAEEAVVHALTGPVLDLIRRNPSFLDFLREA